MRPTLGAVLTVLTVLAGPLWLACSRSPETAGATPPARQPLSVDGAAGLLEALHESAPARERAGGEAAGAPEPAPDSVTFAARLIDAQFRPVAGGSLVLATLGDWGPTAVARARSDANGSVWLATPREGLGAGSAALFALAPGGERMLLPWPAVGAGESIVRLGEIQLRPGGEIRGRVVDEARRPVPRARVFLARRAAPVPESEAPLRRFHPELEPAMPFLGDETDAQGEFVLEGAPVGAWRLVAFTHPEEPDLVPGLCDPVRVVAGEVVAVPEVLLATPAPAELVRGIVRAPAGEPLARAWVSLLAPAGESGSAVARTTCRTDGSFTLLVPAGSAWRLEAVDREQRWPSVRSAVVAGGATLELTFVGGSSAAK